MKKTILLICLLSAGITFGQTKKIFHKSHSGKSGTMFMDSKNNFGPGMAPVRYRTPESPIKLNKIVTDKHEYPMVEIDTIKKVMKFIDLNDSIIGCNRDYNEYLSHGDLVFDNKTNEFYAYHAFANRKPTRIFIKVSDSISIWEKRENAIRRRNAFIRDGNNFRIIMHYPHLNYAIASNLIKPPKPELQITPPVVPNTTDKNKKKDEKKKSPKTKPLRPQPIALAAEKEENDDAFLATIPSGNDTFTLRWIGLFLFVFSVFIFMGVKRIVAEEISKLKR